MDSERVVEAGGVRIRFDTQARIASFEWDHPDRMTPETADALIPEAEKWIGGFSGPFGFLIDGSTSQGTAPGGEGWMARWAAFHACHPPRGRVAVYRPSLFMRGRLLAYNERAKTPLHLFHTERAARAWLAEELDERAPRVLE